MGQCENLFVAVEQVLLHVQIYVCLIKKVLKDVESVWSLREMSADFVWRVDGSVPAVGARAIVGRFVGRLVDRL